MGNKDVKKKPNAARREVVLLLYLTALIFKMRTLPSGFRALIPKTPGRENAADVRKLIMKLEEKGCENRKYFHIVVTKSTYPPIKSKFHPTHIRRYIQPIEQLGSYDPLINANGEKLCSLNLERIVYYLAQGIELDQGTAQLLGLAGVLPQHPETYRTAWRNRRELSRVRIPEVPDEPSNDEAKN